MSASYVTVLLSSILRDLQIKNLLEVLLQIYSTTVAEEHSYRYFCAEQVPKYEEHLTPLNHQ